RRELLERGLGGIEAGLGQMPGNRVAGVVPLEVVHQLREPIDGLGREAEHLAQLACRAAAAIRDDVGGHRGAEPAIALVDVLDDALAPLAARQIEIDIGPLAALFREKPFEEQIHPDRIDGRDAKRITHGTVGGRPAPLYENALAPAVIDDVPDDEEVAGEIEFLDEREFAIDLRTRAVVIRTIAITCPHLRDAPEKRDLVLAGGHRVLRKAVAEIGERE